MTIKYYLLWLGGMVKFLSKEDKDMCNYGKNVLVIHVCVHSFFSCVCVCVLLGKYTWKFTESYRLMTPLTSVIAIKTPFTSARKNI